ncbi:MAG: hypothetical protein ACREON_14175, partial [Gemmatimonadaceae bacterium]
AGSAAEERDAGAGATLSINGAMSGHMVETPHLRLTPRYEANASDDAKAREVVAELRRGIARYADHRTALADGYQIFLPNVPQKVYHCTNYRRAIAATFGFDPAEPTSLLYEKTDAGYKLVGAMYTASRGASLDALNGRVPLSVGQWHAHTNICVPPRGQEARWRESRNGTPLFGPQGSIASKGECDAAGGRFFPQLFGWMLHVNTAAGDDPKAIWGTEHGGGHSH